ncbi:uncharacterized protein LOC113324366 [Papaver somniferum]|uniref:uncharacterized protein LOC113324366 n=1 Tax=Papaver somniferum TaxID=3469 RepID=UPI000E703B12|nr:uncharacterized protein LOC113324366 [Papaver somniferum]
MSTEKSLATTSKNVGNSKPNIDDEFFTKSSSPRKTHPKYVAILLTGSENEGEVQSVRPGSIIRLCLQRKEYPASPIDFKICQSPLRSFEKWMKFMISQDGVRANLTKAQIIGAVTASATLQFRNDTPGLITFVSRWCPDTHTAICRWGEMTISLESVAVLLNLPITGNLDITLSDDEEEIYATLLKKSEGFVRKDYETKCFYRWWVSEWFPDEPDSDLALDDTLHVAAFLALWLSRYIFDDDSGKKEIRRGLVKFVIKLAKGVVLRIGGLFLGSLYTHLDHLVVDMYA